MQLKNSAMIITEPLSSSRPENIEATIHHTKLLAKYPVQNVRKFFDFTQAGNSEPMDAIFISIDFEYTDWRITEFGVSKLDTRDLKRKFFTTEHFCAPWKILTSTNLRENLPTVNPFRLRTVIYWVLSQRSFITRIPYRRSCRR